VVHHVSENTAVIPTPLRAGRDHLQYFEGVYQESPGARVPANAGNEENTENSSAELTGSRHFASSSDLRPSVAAGEDVQIEGKSGDAVVEEALRSPTCSVASANEPSDRLAATSFSHQRDAAFGDDDGETNPFADDLDDEGSAEALVTQPGSSLASASSASATKVHAAEMDARPREMAALIDEDNQDGGAGNPFDDDLATEFGGRR